MKRSILVLIFILISIASLSASNESLNIGFSIPDDYGVVYPAEALRLDRLIFEVGVAAESAQIVEDSNVDLGILSEENRNGVTFTLKYYGNLSYPYSARLYVKSPIVWEGPGGEEVPIDVSLDEANTNPSITAVKSEDYLDIKVMPSGLMLGESVAEINLGWDFGNNPIPGDYSTTLFVMLFAE